MTDTTDTTDQTPPAALPQFPAGQQRTITATVTKDGVPFADTLSWTTTSGTLTVAADTLSATLDNAAAGTVTVTVTDPDGAGAAIQFELVDQASITLAVV